jgi:hypothetical protein
MKAAVKKTIKRLIGQKVIDYTYLTRDAIRLNTINLTNKLFGYSNIDLGAGADAAEISWWTGDVQTGFIFDQSTRLPLKSEIINFAYSSMFFEHISDECAKNLLDEVYRVLKPNSCLRIVVPDFKKYIYKYREGDRNYFYSEDNPNFATWNRMNVSLDMEHLLVGMISSIHNLPHQIVKYPTFEDLAANPPRVYASFQNKLIGYYCGPAPELTTEEIRFRLNSQNENDFLLWVFRETNKSKYQDPTFNSWHKNYWDFEKLTKFALSSGFTKIEKSQYGQKPYFPGIKREKPQHEKLGLYFNIFK